MISDLESENREIEFEEFLDAIISKLGKSIYLIP
jgi:hypothetical protein